MTVNRGLQENIYMFARLVEGFFAITSIIGILWFAGTMGFYALVCASIVFIGSAVASLTPRSLFGDNPYRLVITVLLANTILAALLLAGEDLLREGDDKWISIAQYLLLVFALVVSICEQQTIARGSRGYLGSE